jgi:hypothetical protein
MSARAAVATAAHIKVAKSALLSGTLSYVAVPSDEIRAISNATIIAQNIKASQAYENNQINPNHGRKRSLVREN